MKKIYSSIFLLAVTFSLSVSADMRLEEGEISPEIKAKVMQNLTLFRTLFTEVSCLESHDSGKTFRNAGQFRVAIDMKKNTFFIDAVKQQKDESETENIKYYYADGILTRIHVFNGEKLTGERGFAYISGQKIWMPSEVKPLIYLNTRNILEIEPKFLPVFPSADFDGKGQVWKYIKYQGKAAVSLGAPPKQVHGRATTILSFDAKNGLLLEKKLLIWEKRDGKLVLETPTRLVVNEYFVKDGFSFPKSMELKGGDYILKYQIEQNVTEINKPISEKYFSPTFPPGIEVYDRVKGIEYVSPSIGNSGAEEKMAKELDEYFKTIKK